MKLKQALNILEKQKQKVLNPKYPNNNAWIVETSSFIRTFFGSDSDEYFRIKSFKWTVTILNTTSQETIDILHRKNEMEILMFLDNCKNTLLVKGLFKAEKKNILSDKSNFELLTILFSVLAFSFGLSCWAVKTDIFAVLFNNSNLSFFSTPAIKTKIIP